MVQTFLAINGSTVQRYWCYLIGLAVFGLLYMMQLPGRPKRSAEEAVT